MTGGRFEESALGKISPILGGGNGHSTAVCSCRETAQQIKTLFSGAMVRISSSRPSQWDCASVGIHANTRIEPVFIPEEHNESNNIVNLFKYSSQCDRGARAPRPRVIHRGRRETAANELAAVQRYRAGPRGPQMP